MEELHTIVDLSDPDEIRRDSDACATRWQLEKPWITRTMHRTVRVWRQLANHARGNAPICTGPTAPQPPRGALLAKDAVFFLEIVDDVALLLVDPPSNGDDEALQGLWKRKHTERAYQRWVASTGGVASVALAPRLPLPTAVQPRHQAGRPGGAHPR